MGYEIYRPRANTGLGRLREPALSISRKGQIRVNPALLATLGVEFDATIALLFDREWGRLGLRAHRPGDGYGPKIRRGGDSRDAVGILSVGPGFFTSVGIDSALASGVYFAAWDTDVTPRVLAIQLPQGSWQRPPKPPIQVDDRAIKRRLAAARESARVQAVRS